jgi:4-amino-4-deoxy-L-arabinose transferase-like glycosyltransferase
MRYPAPFVDEAWLTSRAWAFLHTGHQLGSLDMGVAENLPGGWVANQWLITALQSICLRIAGQPSLFAVRLLSLGWGVLLIAATFQIGRQIFSKATALFGGMLLAFSISFFYSAHSARYDIMAASLGYCAVAFYFSIKNDSLLNGLWIGLLVSMAVETHLNSLIFGVALLGMFIVDN